MTRTTSALTPAQLYDQLTGRSFATYADFEREFVALFNRHAFDFPVDYGWRDAVRWGVRHEVVRRDGDRIVVRASA